MNVAISGPEGRGVWQVQRGTVLLQGVGQATSLTENFWLPAPSHQPPG